MDVSDPNNNDPWYNQSHYQALFFGTAVALGVSAHYYRRQQAVANCKVKDVDFSNKTVIVTGANTGIGYAAAEQFAELGAKVVLACRDPVKGNQAAQAIKLRHQNAHVTTEVLDVSNLESIRQFSSRMDRCHVLVNNAGALFESKEMLASGIEKTFMTNYVGPWYLTRLLLPTLAKTSVEDQCETKIVVVGSRTETWSQLKTTFAESGENAVKSVFTGPLSPYKAMQAYSNSKLGNMLMTFELARRLEAARKTSQGGASSDFTSSSAWRELIYFDPLRSTTQSATSSSSSNNVNKSSSNSSNSSNSKPASLKGLFRAPPPSSVDPYDSSYNAPLTTTSRSTLAYPYITVNAVTPGMVNTDIARDVAAKTWWAYLVVRPIMYLTWKTPVEGGSEIVYAASQQNQSGQYFGEHSVVAASAHAQNPALARAMWTLTDKVVSRLLTHDEHVAEMLQDEE